ncbi:MAG: ECF transporter S component [Oscillospiraceae bacterium]|nr:ECF transporter S component [Oscillospiraceae bacterium]
MNKMNPIHRTVLGALFVALCVVLPIAFHSIPDAGSVLLPMHIPVLVCGLICGWPYGFICGLLGPALSCLLTGMPTMAILPAMMIECATYGAITGLILKFIRTKNLTLDLYVALIIAMIAGRITSGIAKALIFSPGITMTAWITASFVTALPGILLQLVLIPQVVRLLMKTKYLPDRYPKGILK